MAVLSLAHKFFIILFAFCIQSSLAKPPIHKSEDSNNELDTILNDIVDHVAPHHVPFKSVEESKLYLLSKVNDQLIPPFGPTLNLPTTYDTNTVQNPIASSHVPVSRSPKSYDQFCGFPVNLPSSSHDISNYSNDRLRGSLTSSSPSYPSHEPINYPSFCQNISYDFSLYHDNFQNTAEHSPGVYEHIQQIYDDLVHTTTIRNDGHEGPSGSYLGQSQHPTESPSLSDVLNSGLELGPFPSNTHTHHQIPQPHLQKPPQPHQALSKLNQVLSQPHQEFPQLHQVLSQPRQKFPQPHQVLSQPHQEFPQPHQEFPQLHQVLSQPHQEFPQPHQVLSQPHQEFPQSHQEFPQPHQVFSQPHQEFPQSHQEYPQPHQEYPQPHQEFPQPHQEYPQPHQEYPQPHQVFSQPHQEFPQPHQEFPQSHQEFPQPHQEFPQLHQVLSQPHQESPQPHQVFSQPHQESPQPHQKFPQLHQEFQQPHQVLSQPHQDVLQLNIQQLSQSLFAPLNDEGIINIPIPSAQLNAAYNSALEIALNNTSLPRVNSSQLESSPHPSLPNTIQGQSTFDTANVASSSMKNVKKPSPMEEPTKIRREEYQKLMYQQLVPARQESVPRSLLPYLNKVRPSSSSSPSISSSSPELIEPVMSPPKPRLISKSKSLARKAPKRPLSHNEDLPSTSTDLPPGSWQAKHHSDTPSSPGLSRTSNHSSHVLDLSGHLSDSSTSSEGSPMVDIPKKERFSIYRHVDKRPRRVHQMFHNLPLMQSKDREFYVRVMNKPQSATEKTDGTANSHDMDQYVVLHNIDEGILKTVHERTIDVSPARRLEYFRVTNPSLISGSSSETKKNIRGQPQKKKVVDPLSPDFKRSCFYLMFNSELSPSVSGDYFGHVHSNSIIFTQYPTNKTKLYPLTVFCHVDNHLYGVLGTGEMSQVLLDTKSLSFRVQICEDGSVYSETRWTRVPPNLIFEGGETLACPQHVANTLRKRTRLILVVNSIQRNMDVCRKVQIVTVSIDSYKHLESAAYRNSIGEIPHRLTMHSDGINDVIGWFPVQLEKSPANDPIRFKIPSGKASNET